MEHSGGMDVNWTTTASDFLTSTTTPNQQLADCSQFAKFITNTIIAGCICILGFVGNSVSLFVLRWDSECRVAAFLLQALACTDNFFLAAWFLHFTLADAFIYFQWEPEFHASWLYTRVYTYPLLFIGQTGTIWLTVLIAATRYVSVCWPYRAATLCTYPIVTKCVIGVLVFSVLYNVPRFFESKIDVIHGGVNDTTTYYNYGLTHFGRSGFYRNFYFDALYILTSFGLPLALLLFLNTKLTLAYRQVQRRRSSMRMRESHEHSITLVMIMVILLFIVCNAPARIVQMIWDYNTYTCPSVAFILTTVSNVMEVFNSSSNFIIYCVFRGQFRVLMTRHVCHSKHMSDVDVDDGVSATGREPLQSVGAVNGTTITTYLVKHEEGQLTSDKEIV